VDERNAATVTICPSGQPDPKAVLGARLAPGTIGCTVSQHSVTHQRVRAAAPAVIAMTGTAARRAWMDSAVAGAATKSLGDGEIHAVAVFGELACFSAIASRTSWLMRMDNTTVAAPCDLTQQQLPIVVA
jgi:hypothetical protein